METKLFIATKGVVVHDGKILILREAGSYVDGTNTGRYDFPGGRLHPGERFDEALKREVFEETGLQVEIGNIVGVNEWRPVVRGEQWQIVGMFFECHAAVKDVQLSEDHDSCEWIDAGDYSKFPIIENLVPIIKKYI